jgi:hypothetical protein
MLAANCEPARVALGGVGDTGPSLADTGREA